MSENPYQSPTTGNDSDEPSPGQSVAYKLYSVGQVTLATFLGSPMAGCVLLAANYSRLGNRKAAVRTIGIGFVATLVFIVSSMAIPESVKIPQAVFVLVPCAVMFKVADLLQGSALRRHIHLRKGQKESSWKAAGIGLACAVVIVVLILIVTFLGILLFPEEFPAE